MECSEALTLLSGHIDHQNTVQEEAALQAHLSVCPDCRALLRAYEDIDRNVAELSEPAPEGLAAAVMSQIAKQEQKKKRAPWLGIGASAGIVAAVLILLVGTKTLRLPKPSDKHVNENSLIMTQAPAAPRMAAETNPVGEVNPGGTTDTAANPSTPAVGENRKGNLSGALDPSVHSLCGPVSTQLADRCTALSVENNAPVLLYSGISSDFFTLMEQLIPALTDRLNLSGKASVEEDLGIVTVSSDFETVAAIQELIRNLLLTEETERSFAADVLDDLRSQYAQFGFDGSHLEKLLPAGLASSVSILSGFLPEDFVQKWVTGENWRLFFPEGADTPTDDSPAYLVLLPPVSAS